MIIYVRVHSLVTGITNACPFSGVTCGYWLINKQYFNVENLGADYNGFKTKQLSQVDKESLRALLLAAV